MRALRLFLSRFLLGLWIVLFSTFLCLIVVEFREGGVTVPMAGVALVSESGGEAVDLPNRIFTCTATASQEQCQADIQGRSLVVTVEEISATGTYQCEAQYDGRSIRCENKGLDYAPATSPSVEVTGLGLSPAELEQVRQKHWGIRTMMTLGERRLLRIAGGLSVAAGLLAAYFAWTHSNRWSKGLASIAIGFLMYVWVGSFLNQVNFSTVAPYGFTADAWMWAANAGAIAAGIVGTSAVGFWLRGRSHPAIRAAISLSSGAGSFLITGTALVLLLLSSGFVD